MLEPRSIVKQTTLSWKVDSKLHTEGRRIKAITEKDKIPSTEAYKANDLSQECPPFQFQKRSTLAGDNHYGSSGFYCRHKEDPLCI